MANLSESSTKIPEPLQKLWDDFARTRDVELQQQLIVQYMHHARRIATRIRARLPASVDLEDLVQVGMIGLSRAILGFDPQRGNKFETYAGHVIRGKILDDLRSEDWIPRLARQRAQKVDVAVRRLRQQLGRNPSDDEIAAHFKLSPAAYAKLMAEARLAKQRSLHHESRDDQGRPISAADLHSDPKSLNPATQTARDDLKRMITQGLDRADRLILILYYYEKLTMREIGVTLGMSESRICQKHTDIVARLKATLRQEQRDDLSGED